MQRTSIIPIRSRRAAAIAALPVACLAATLYGFVPTGAVAFALAARAATMGGRDPMAAARLRRQAAHWLVATLVIGAAVELPVIAAALS